jgi:hypothetical protein
MGKRYRVHGQYLIHMEASKDDVIDTLAWMLASAGIPVRVVFPNGTVVADYVGADGETVKEEGE